LKKLLPASTAELTVVYREMPPVRAPAVARRGRAQEMLLSISSFDALGVRVGALVPQSPPSSTGSRSA
jgi:hypothetical protein